MTTPRQTGAVPAFASRDAAGDAPIPTSSISVGFPKSASHIVSPTAPAVIETKDRDSYAVTAIEDITDRSLHAAIARFTSGISPAALAYAYLDWATHLTYAPGKRLQLFDKAMRKAIRFANYASRSVMEGGKTKYCIEPLPQDKRFVGEDWRRWPFSFMHQAFLLHQQWWRNATTGVHGISKQHEGHSRVHVTQDP